MTVRGQFTRSMCLVAGTAIALLIESIAIPVSAGNSDTLSMNYGIYVSGSRIFRISYHASLSSDGYETAVDIAPRGLAKIFADFKLRMATSGVFDNGLPEPHKFRMESSKDDENKKVAMTWPSDGGLPKAVRSFRLPKNRSADISGVLDADMPDPLTAVLRHALKGGLKPCKRTLRSYNGAEVYDLKFSYLGEDTLRDGKDGAYDGPAYKCRMVFVPVAGFSAKKMRKHLAHPPTFTLWFAQVTSPSTATRFLVPVRGAGKAAGRSFVILASDATVSGRPLASLAQASN